MNIRLTIQIAMTGAALAACLSLLTTAVHAQNANNPPEAQRAHTLQSPPHHNRVVSSVQRGTNAAGRGVNHADSATRRGVANVAEKASRPVRRFGDAIGRRLGPGPNSGAAPAVGPQGNAP